LAGATLALVVWVLKQNVGRAVLCLAPSSIAIEAEDPADRMSLPLELAPLAGDLTRLGFTAIGSRREKAPLGPAQFFYDFAQKSDGVFATLSLGKDRKPRLFYLTFTRRGGFVITANYRRPALEIPGLYLSGSLEDFPSERVYKAHLRRIEGVEAAGEYTQDGRVAVAKAWLAGPGRAELRLENLQGLVWTAGGLGILAAAIFGSR
jgi:hypothetical protein